MLLQDIQLMCVDVQARPFETLNTADRVVRHDGLFQLERRLCLATRITTLLGSNQAAAQEDYTAMWRAVALSALMYVHHHLRPGWALHWAQFRALSAALHRELLSTRTQTWSECAALHLWTLAVGSWVSQKEDWILRMLADALRSYGIISWEAFELKLAQCPCVGGADSEKFAVIWECVHRLI